MKLAEHMFSFGFWLIIAGIWVNELTSLTQKLCGSGGVFIVVGFLRIIFREIKEES